ncbi:MAG: thiamine biosynthesis protein ThiS [Legionellales bacterium RIFCSPHIGHO2_12_FULL_35_11]|nr:MAG: thiamine biosynthesis protein ThiS [Legionellales bacterium RIFCSPHIGHO2_12_FULL_35_11]
MINIYFNDESHQVESQSLQEFLLHKNHIDSHFAIAINSLFIPRTAYKTTLLYDGDRVDMIVPMQGG